MSRYLVDGSFPLSGTIKASGNKNAALPCIAATLLTDEEVVLSNIPDIEDVAVMLGVIEALGATVEMTAPGAYRINTSTLKSSDVPPEFAKKIRASLLFAGPNQPGGGFVGGIVVSLIAP